MNGSKTVVSEQNSMANTVPTVGNAPLEKLPGSHEVNFRNLPIQAKLTVGAVDDPLEKEADTMADQIMRMPEDNFIQKKCSACEEEDTVQRAPLVNFIQKKGGISGTMAPEGVANSIEQSRGKGRALPKGTKSFMESRFGTDFSGVNIHTGGNAIQMSRELGAKAFTVGNDIYFNQGQFNPHSNSGKHLLAHELTHVVQQNGNSAAHTAQAKVVQRQEHDSQTSAASMTLDEELEATRSALASIHEQMSTGIFDWWVSEAEASTVFAILRRQEPSVLLRVVQALRISNRGQTFLNALSEEDLSAFDMFSEVFSTDTGYLAHGDIIRIEVFANTRQTEYEFTLDLNVESTGIRPFFLDEPLPIANLLPQDAAELLAHTYREEQIFVEPRVRLLVLERGAFYAPRHGSTSQSIWFEGVERLSPEASTNLDKRMEFLDYIRFIDVSDDPTLARASVHYMNWFEEHNGTEEFLERSPADLWSWALEVAMTPLPQTPVQPFLDLLRHQQSRMDALTQEQQTIHLGAIGRYLDWIDQHMEANDYDLYDPIDIWIRSYSRSSSAHIHRLREATYRRVLEEGRDQRRREQMAAREERFQEHFNMAMQLWGYSQRNYPYVIPIPSEGRDILVTGHPARQAALDMLASALMDHAANAMFDSGYTSVTQSPEAILLNLMEGDLGTALDVANTLPVASESIDRHELMPGRILASFGETVGTGLLIIGVVGAAVGAGIVSAPVAVVVLLGAAATAGVVSYLDRREEIERQNYDVPIPETMLHSVGDVVGLSQLIEGISGERLGTGRRLSSVERSDQTGTGAGGMALLLTGSKAYRFGQLRGQRFRLSRPGNTPPGPEGGRIPNPEETPPIDTTAPVPSENMGPTETALRNALDQNVRVGFDTWIAEIRAGGNNPETVLNRIPARRRLDVARRRAERFTEEFMDRLRQEELRVRSLDNPLNPRMRVTEQAIPGDDGVLLRYNNRRPAEHEIQQAIRLHQRTGEPIEVFGDTAAGVDYPGIDGTIGSPRRPLSLKHAAPEANPNFARFQAEEALIKADRNGYGHVEVQIEMSGSTVAEIQAAWNAPSLRPGQTAPRPVMDAANTIAKIVIQASDGIWVIEPPLTGPGLPGIVIPLPDFEDDTDDQ